MPKKFFKKRKAPGLRGFGVFGIQHSLNKTVGSGVERVRDARTGCIEAVHGSESVWRSKCGRGLAPDGGVSGTDVVTDLLLSGASPLPH